MFQIATQHSGETGRLGVQVRFQDQEIDGSLGDAHDLREKSVSPLQCAPSVAGLHDEGIPQKGLACQVVEQACPVLRVVQADRRPLEAVERVVMAWPNPQASPAGNVSHHPAQFLFLIGENEQDTSTIIHGRCHGGQPSPLGKFTGTLGRPHTRPPAVAQRHLELLDVQRVLVLGKGVERQRQERGRLPTLDALPVESHTILPQAPHRGSQMLGVVHVLLAVAQDIDAL